MSIKVLPREVPVPDTYISIQDGACGGVDIVAERGGRRQIIMRIFESGFMTVYTVLDVGIDVGKGGHIKRYIPPLANPDETT